MASRQTTFLEVEKVFPEALAWVLTSYGAPSHLQYGDSTISSDRGFHQGDPLAGLLFSANLQPVIDTIEEEVPDLEVDAWFLDDGDQVGTLDQLRKVVDILLREGPPRGLVLSTSATVPAPGRPKTTVWCPADLSSMPEDPLQRGLLRVREPGIILLGAPLGTPQFVREELSKKVEKVQEITSLLPGIEDPHTEFVLLRSCLALPKLMFSLRTVDTSAHQEPLIEYDRVTREALTRIMGSPLQDQQWSQATLPTSMGGLGLRSAVEHAPGAYAASYTSSQPLLKALLAIPEETPCLPLPQTTLDRFSELLGEETTTETLEGMGQKFLSLQADLAAAARLSDSVAAQGSLREQARLASLSLPYAGSWLNVVPSPALALHLRGPEFISAIKYRLGANIFRSAGPCPACSAHSDTLGDHALCCGSKGERVSRHNALRDALYSTAVAASLGPSREGRFLLPGDDRRPADVLIPHWTGGQDTAWDVTVIHPLQAATVAGAAASPGHALEVAVNRKNRGALEDCRRQGIKFIPLAVESLGGWHELAVGEIRKLAAALARQSGQEEKEARGHLLQRLSVSLIRGNRALFVNRIPDSVEAHIEGQE